MKHYINSNDELFAFEEDGSQDHLITGDLRPATDTEVAAIQNPAPTAEQLTANAHAQRDALLRDAALRIAPLQDAADLGEATAAEEASLIAWKQYRVKLNRIQLQPNFPEEIDWPEVPA